MYQIHLTVQICPNAPDLSGIAFYVFFRLRLDYVKKRKIKNVKKIVKKRERTRRRKNVK